MLGPHQRTRPGRHWSDSQRRAKKPAKLCPWEFPIPLPPHVMKVRAVVRYSDGLRCGFEFLVVTEEQKQMLHQVCVVLANAS